MNNGADWWQKNKLQLSLLPALLFWAVSMACFVFGLNFNTEFLGVNGANLGMFIAGALAVANTFVQVVGNDQDPEKMDFFFRIGWWGSYLLGIGSNVNTLSHVLVMDNVYLGFVVALGLGSMIEVLPEKLLVQFLQSVRVKPMVKVDTVSKRLTPTMSNLPRKNPYMVERAPLKTRDDDEFFQHFMDRES